MPVKYRTTCALFFIFHPDLKSGSSIKIKEAIEICANVTITSKYAVSK
jgi:hypothetical protein